MLKHTLTAAALAAILASPAFAGQKARHHGQARHCRASSMPALSKVEHQSFVQNQHATDWRGLKLIGAIVYGQNNASIGSANEL